MVTFDEGLVEGGVVGRIYHLMCSKAIAAAPVRMADHSWTADNDTPTPKALHPAGKISEVYTNDGHSTPAAKLEFVSTNGIKRPGFYSQAHKKENKESACAIG